jgi:hypothetical protein
MAGKPQKIGCAISVLLEGKSDERIIQEKGAVGKLNHSFKFLFFNYLNCGLFCGKPPLKSAVQVTGFRPKFRLFRSPVGGRAAGAVENVFFTGNFRESC